MITASNLEFRLSNPAASAGNQLAQADPNASLGGFLASTVWLGSALHDLFHAVSGNENASLSVAYRCLFIINKHATLTWQGPVLWLPSQVSGGAALAIGVDPVAASALTSGAAQARRVINENTAPTGVTFSAPTTKGAGLALGDIAPGFAKALWLRRSAANSAALAGDGADIRCEGDTL